MSDSKESIEKSLKEAQEHQYDTSNYLIHLDAVEDVETELDDPYLELFDRINQMALDIKSLEMEVKELVNKLIKNNVPGFVHVPVNYDYTLVKYNPITGEIETTKGNLQEEFKFFD